MGGSCATGKLGDLEILVVKRLPSSNLLLKCAATCACHNDTHASCDGSWQDHDEIDFVERKDCFQ
jgi:hypothetical protein